MDFNVIISAIGSLGFPIVMAIVMVWMFIKFTDNYRADVKSMVDAVNNNTMAIQRLIDKIDKEDKQIGRAHV